MKLGLTFPEFWAGLSQFALDEWHRVIAAIQTWTVVEHNDDGTHGDLTFTSLTGDVTDLRVGLKAGTRARPSLTFVDDTHESGQDPFTAANWPGFYRIDAGGVWMYALADADKWGWNNVGVFPIDSGLWLGGDSTIFTGPGGETAKRWERVLANTLDYRALQIGAAGGVSFTNTGTVAALDLSVDTVSYHEFNGGGALTVQGILQPTVGLVTPMQIIHNNVASTVTLNHNDGAASAAHRLQSPTGANVVLGQFDTAVLFHNGTDWRYQSIAL